MKLDIHVETTPQIDATRGPDDGDDTVGLALYFLARIITHLQADDCDHTHCHMFDAAGDLVATVELED